MPRVPPRPALYRLTRLLGILGTVTLVAVLAYVGLTVASAAQVRVSAVGGSPSVVVANNVVTVSTGFVVRNPGPLTVSGVALTSVVRTAGGWLLAVAESPPTTIPASATVTVPVVAPISLDALLASSSGGLAQVLALLTHSESLPTNTSANATFGGILALHVSDSSSIDWGAPFDGFNATAGSPSLQVNGTLLVPVTVTFTDRAPFADQGTITARIQTATGASPCPGASLDLGVPSGASFNRTVDLYASPSCDPRGGLLLLSYTGSGLTVSLPSEAIP